MRKAMLAKIRSEGMSEDDVAKMMAVFDKQGSKNVSGGVWWGHIVFITGYNMSNYTANND